MKGIFNLGAWLTGPYLHLVYVLLVLVALVLAGGAPETIGGGGG